ncbi:MAG: glucokinase [Desulfurivibrio sp.]|nr:glucokinase [Desulfurivibrio sp.]
MKNLLCADIGATNSRFAYFTLNPPTINGDDNPPAGEPDTLELQAVHWLPTTPDGSLNAQLRALYNTGFPLPAAQTDLAVLAVAGPVSGGGRYSRLPLAGWEVDLAVIEQEFPFAAAVLINDFTAQALAVLAPPGSAAREILPGQADPAGPLAIVGAGTGLGKALLLPGGGSPTAAAPTRPTPLVIPSEGGHADFPFAGGRERDYLEFLRQQRHEERISGNTVVSGQGLAYLHHFLTGEQLAPAAVVKRCHPDSPTLAWAARFYGRVCRNYALETLATGGLYIAGGVAAKAPELLTHAEFAREFHHSPTMGELLQKIPIRLINDQNSGLWGAAIQASLLLAHPAPAGTPLQNGHQACSKP